MVEIFNPQKGAVYFGWLAGFNGVTVIIFTPLITKLFEKTKNIRKVALGGLLYAAGFGLFSISFKLPLFLLFTFLFTIGEIIISISSMPFIMNHTPHSHRGRMGGVLPLIYGTGFTLGPYLMGIILLKVTIKEGWILIGILGVVSFLLMLLLEKFDYIFKKKK